MKEKLTLGSLFDGIGGFPLSAKEYGIIPVWASEIEPLPIAVTKEHFPEMKHLGDIKALSGNKLEPTDIISGGSPCQDLSVAGKRQVLTWKNKLGSNCARYKALGNSVAIPCVKYVMKRIKEALYDK